jgi:hypothetical protein
VFLATECALLQDESAAHARNTVLSSRGILADVTELLTVGIELVHSFRFCQCELESIPRSGNNLLVQNILTRSESVCWQGRESTSDETYLRGVRKSSTGVGFIYQ